MAITGDIIVTRTVRIVDNVGGSRDVDSTLSIENARMLEWDTQITASMADTVIWDATATVTPPLASFDFLELLSTTALQVELSVGHGSTPRVIPIVLAANFPFTLYGDDGLDGTGASITDAFTSGVVAQINRIAIKEVAGATGELHVTMAKKV